MEVVSVATRTVILLGEGNFSYALARLRLHMANVTAKKANGHLRMVATSFDSQAELFQKYPEAVQILQKMQQLGTREESLSVQIVHQVDATRIKDTLPVAQELIEGVDEVTFCHPHIGSEDLRRNSALVAHFFDSAKTAFPTPPRLLQLTLLQSQYERWEIGKLEQLNGLALLGQQQHTLNPALYLHGYETRRHQSGKSFSTSKVGKNFTIQSMAYLYSIIDAPKTLSENDGEQFVLDSGVVPYIEEPIVVEQEESKQPVAQELPRFPCSSCPKIFSSDRALKNHEKSHEETKVSDTAQSSSSADLICPHCQRGFTLEDSMTQHVRSKHEQGGKASLSADHKGIRLEICTTPTAETTEDICTICGQASHGADFLQPPVELSLECPYCQRAFVNQRALTQHSTLSCKKRPQP